MKLKFSNYTGYRYQTFNYTL